jgi:fumarate reductase flavoprotein subunit
MMFDSVEWHNDPGLSGGKRKDKSGTWMAGDFNLVKTLCSQSLPTLKWAESLGWPSIPNFPLRGGHVDPGTQSHGQEALFRHAHQGGLWRRAARSCWRPRRNPSSCRWPGDRCQAVRGTAPGDRPRQEGRGHGHGGFGANAAMVAEYNNYWPSIPLDMKTTCVSTVTGDGITMGKAVGPTWSACSSPSSCPRRTPRPAS